MAAVKSVGIVGAGIGGLTLAHALRCHCPAISTVHVYDRFDKIRPAVGAGFGLNGGAVLLAQMGFSDQLHELMTPFERFRATTASGRRLGEVDMIKSLSGLPAFQHGGRRFVGQAMRADVHSMLASALPPGTLSTSKRLETLESTPNGVQLHFTDGTESPPYDLVVGADGIHSTVRKAVAGDVTADYTGLQIIFGVAEQPIRKDERAVVAVWGDGVAGLHFSAGGSTRRDIVAVSSRSPVPAPEVWDAAAAQQEGLQVVSAARMPAEVQDLVAGCSRMFKLGIYHHRQLERWSDPEGRIVLIGDASHATSPYMGQGANQAIQDAVALATRLANVGKEYTNVAAALQSYEARRKPVTTEITNNSYMLGRLETSSGLQAYGRDALMWGLLSSGILLKQLARKATPVI